MHLPPPTAVDLEAAGRWKEPSFRQLKSPLNYSIDGAGCFQDVKSQENLRMFLRSQTLPISIEHHMNNHSMPINHRHRDLFSISPYKENSNSPEFSSSFLPLPAPSSPQLISRHLTLSPPWDGNNTIPTSTSEIVEDYSSQWERRSISLQELFEVESRGGVGLSAHEYGELFVSRDDHVSGFSNSAWPQNYDSESSNSRQISTLLELLRSEDDQHHSKMRHSRRRRSFSWKRIIHFFRSGLRRNLWKGSRNSSMPESHSHQIAISGSEHKQELTTCWSMKAQRSKPYASRLSHMRLSSSPSVLSRQLSRSSSAHEQYYLSRRIQDIRSRKRTFLPYREQLISFFYTSKLN